MTDRSLGALLQAGAQSSEFNYIVFVALGFPSGTVYAHNGVGTYSFGGNDYIGVGAFGKIDVMEETLDLASKPVRLSLSSVNSSIIDAIKTDDVFGRTANVYLGSISRDGRLQGTPDNWFSGHMETVEINLGQEDGITIQLQSRASRLRLRNNKRYTIEDHQNDYATDLGLEFLPYLIDAQVTWAGEQVRTGFLNHGTLDPSDYESSGGSAGRGGRRAPRER